MKAGKWRAVTGRQVQQLGNCIAGNLKRVTYGNLFHNEQDVYNNAVERNKEMNMGNVEDMRDKQHIVCITVE